MPDRGTDAPGHDLGIARLTADQFLGQPGILLVAGIIRRGQRLSYIHGVQGLPGDLLPAEFHGLTATAQNRGADDEKRPQRAPVRVSEGQTPSPV